MDAEKDHPLPHKSETDDDDNKNDNNSSSNHEKPEAVQNLETNGGDNSPSAPEPPSDLVPNSEIAGESGINYEEKPAETTDDPEPEIKEEKEPAGTPNGIESENKTEEGQAKTADAPDSEIKAEKEPAETADGIESEIKEEEKPDEMNFEEAPPSPLNLRKLSVEIDQYISMLSTSNNAESTPPDGESTPPDGESAPPDEESTPPDGESAPQDGESAPQDGESAPQDGESAPPDGESASQHVPNFVEQFVIMIEAQVLDYESGDSPVKWSQLSEEDSASLLESITRLGSLSKVLSEFSSEQKYASPINLIGGILQHALMYVEEEFKSLLEDYKIQGSDPNSVNDTKSKQSSSSASNEQSEQTPPDESDTALKEESYFPGYSEETLSGLIRISKVIMAAGHEMECHGSYFIARRNALEDSLQKLGFEKRSIDDVQKMQWESLEREIATWIRTFKLCATHFSSEQKLSSAIFPDYPSISQSLFCTLSQGVIIQLLNFSGAVALTKRSSEKLFKLLDLYEALRDTPPTLDDLFPEEWMDEVRTEASLIKGRLGDAIISIFSELESSVKADSGKIPVPGGAVHPLTRYIMNYLKLAGVYKETLEQVYRQHQKIERTDSTTGSDFNYNSQAPLVPPKEELKHSPFHAQLIKIMDLLDENLDAKSKLYKDLSLSSIFMMNNGRYILQRVRGSDELNSLMGDSWCRKKSTDLRQCHKVYQRETWGKLLSCLHPEGLMSHGKVVNPVLKERFNSFNRMFDEIHRTQSTWVVCDEQLQSELRVSISNMVIPAYRSYLARYGQAFTP